MTGSSIDARAALEQLNERHVVILRTVTTALGATVVVLSGVVIWMYARTTRLPTSQEVHVVNMLTTAAMSSALISLVASETLWTILLKRVDPAQAGTRVLTAYILRTVLRECAGIVGIVAAIVAASNGTLRVFPAYWVNMVPAALFLVYLFAHWPRHKNERAPFISG